MVQVTDITNQPENIFNPPVRLNFYELGGGLTDRKIETINFGVGKNEEEKGKDNENNR